MKKWLLAAFVFLSLTAGAQSATVSGVEKEATTLVFEKYGYLQGIRLDSLPSKYIHVSVLAGTIYIDYGQQPSQREQRVTDHAGRKIGFSSFWAEGLGALFNFLDYNGWEYVDNLVDPNPKSSDKFFVFEKKG